MSCLYRKIIVFAVWQHWADKITFCLFFTFRSLFFRFLHDFLHILQTDIVNAINYLHFYKKKNNNNTMFLVLEKLCKNFKINIFWKILAQINTPYSAEHCGRKKRVANFFSLKNVLNNVTYHYKSVKCNFLGGQSARRAEKQVCQLATLGIKGLSNDFVFDQKIRDFYVSDFEHKFGHDQTERSRANTNAP